MKLLTLLQTKTLVAIVAGVLLVGGATAAFAATSAGQMVVQSFAHTHPTITAAATHDAKSQTKVSGANMLFLEAFQRQQTLLSLPGQ